MPKGVHNNHRGYLLKGYGPMQEHPPKPEPYRHHKQEPTISASIRLNARQIAGAEEAASAMGLTRYAWLIYAIETMVGVHEGKWTVVPLDVEQDYGLGLEPVEEVEA